MNAALRCVGQQRLADLRGFLLLKAQPWIDVRIGQCRLGAGQDPEPLADAQCLLEALADPGEINVSLGVHASTFRPEPCRSLGAEHVQRCLTDLTLTTWVQQVVDRPQLGGRDTKPQD